MIRSKKGGFEVSIKDNLPKLQGNAEQITSAAEIRDNFFTELESTIAKTKSLDRQMMKKDREKAEIFSGLAGMLSDMEPIIISHFSEITDAQYWIENQDKKVEELLMKQLPIAMKEISAGRTHV